MKRKKYFLNSNGNFLNKTEIINYRSWDCDTLTLDVRKLMESTDKELMSYRGVGVKNLEKINKVREVLKELLFEK